MILTFETVFSLLALALLIVSLAPLETADYSRAVLFAKANDVAEVLMQENSFEDAQRVAEFEEALDITVEVTNSPQADVGEVVVKRTVLKGNKFEDVFFVVSSGR